MPAGEFIGSAASTAASGILGLFLGEYNDNRQEEQQQRLTNIQLNAQKKMSDYNFMKQMEMWKNTNYPAQMEMLNKAGLNPALLYGMGGGGGQSTGTPADNVGGAHASAQTGEVQALMGMGIQNQMVQAQIENIKANTEKTKVDTAKTAGVDTQETQTRIASLAQGIENQKAQQLILGIDANLKNMELFTKGQTLQATVDRIEYETEMAYQKVQHARMETFIQGSTITDAIQIIQQKAIEGVLRNALLEAQKNNTITDTQLKRAQQALTQAQTGLTGAETKATWSGIAQKWQQLSNDQRRVYLAESLGFDQTTKDPFIEKLGGLIDGIIGIPIPGPKARRIGY